MKYEREELDKINLHTLRNIARKVGVRAPTSLTKKVLIDEILQIQSGKKQPFPKTKSGRPVKIHLENDISESERLFANSLLTITKSDVKKTFIDLILREIEKKLNELL